MNDSKHTGSNVLTAVVMKSYIFWDVTLCSIFKVNRYLSTLKTEVMKYVPLKCRLTSSGLHNIISKNPNSSTLNIIVSQ
jgi:hypothetical protein